MKSLFFTMLFLPSLLMQGQESVFRLDYGMQGLGGNRFRPFFPVVKVEGTRMTYTINEKKSSTHTTSIRRSSVDSIIRIVGQLQDSVIFRSNHCILSGAYHYLSIVKGQSTFRFTLMNTFDSSAKRISDILNSYLPPKAKIEVEEGWMARETACLDYLQKKVDSASRH